MKVGQPYHTVYQFVRTPRASSCSGRDRVGTWCPSRLSSDCELTPAPAGAPPRRGHRATPSGPAADPGRDAIGGRAATVAAVLRSFNLAAGESDLADPT